MNKDPRLLQLIPHRPPMLLIDQLLEVSANRSSAQVNITPTSSFYVEGKGVPAWIGLEYMGQTAALIAGFQLEQGLVEPHLGLLLGTRKYSAHTPWFAPGAQLRIICQELAVVGQSLANFTCEIQDLHSDALLASARLTVYRRPHNNEV